MELPESSILLGPDAQETGRNELDQPGVEERCDNRRATPGKHDPWNHPISAGLGRIDIDPISTRPARRVGMMLSGPTITAVATVRTKLDASCQRSSRCRRLAVKRPAAPRP